MSHEDERGIKKGNPTYKCPVLGCNRWFYSPEMRRNHIACCHNKDQKVMKINKKEFLKEEPAIYKVSSPSKKVYREIKKIHEEEPSERILESLHHKTECKIGHEPSPVGGQLIILEKNLLDLENKIQLLSRRLIPISKDSDMDEGYRGDPEKCEENFVKRLLQINGHISRLTGNIDVMIGDLEI